MSVVKSEIRSLVDTLNVYRDSYYNKNVSIVSDYEYDMLFDKLEKLEYETGIIYTDSPTQTVGYEVISSLVKVQHDHTVASLKKETDMDKFIKFFGGKEAVLMAKMDGLTCALYYKDGKLVSAKSRGDGEIGEDITHTIKAVKNVPLKIPFMGELWVDGEAIITYDDFNKLNDEIAYENRKIAKDKSMTPEEIESYVESKKYKNPRNLASGSIRNLDSSICAKRNVQFISWKLHKSIDKNGNRECERYADNLIKLKELGFTVVPCMYCNNIKEQFPSGVDFLKKQCEDLNYPIDGMVATFNDIKYGESLGATSHHPNHSIAFKFYQERNVTVLKDIEWSANRTGVISPVAIFEPVEIDGTTVSRATLNNVSIIKELEIGIGDEISVIKSNQIIPMIVDNLTRSNTYEIPKCCPGCGHPTEIRMISDRAALYCTNPECPSKMCDRLVNFCSRDGMNIVGLSDERIKTLVQLGYIKKYTDIFVLSKYYDTMIAIEKFGENSVMKLLDYIDKSRHCKLSNVITAIGIPGVGKSSAKALSKFVLKQYQNEKDKFANSFQKFVNMGNECFDWTLLEDFGETTSNNINSFLNDNRNELLLLSDFLYIIDDDIDVSISLNVLGGKTFCVTGKLTLYSNRDELVADIEKYGGKIVSGVTAKTNYLVTNDTTSGSSKNEKASKLDIPIISEMEFQKLINKCN